MGRDIVLQTRQPVPCAWSNQCWKLSSEHPGPDYAYLNPMRLPWSPDKLSSAATSTPLCIRDLSSSLLLLQAGLWALLPLHLIHKGGEATTEMQAQPQPTRRSILHAAHLPKTPRPSHTPPLQSWHACTSGRS